MIDKRKHATKAPSYPSSKSPVPESVKSKVKNEGITARNLIKFNVPVENSSARKRCTSDKSSPQKRPTQNLQNVTSQQSETIQKPKESTKSSSACLENTLSTSQCGSKSLNSSLRSSITMLGDRDDCEPNYQVILTNSDYKARYWGQMLNTLKRTTDEIYSACEFDQSEVECKEVIMILEHSIKDFRSLIEKINVLRDYEQLAEEKKPISIAWDERKTFAGKPIMKQVLRRHSKGSSPSSTPLLNKKLEMKRETTERSLPKSKNLTTVLSNGPISNPTAPEGTTVQTNISTGCTWADRVKGNKVPSHVPVEIPTEQPPINGEVIHSNDLPNGENVSKTDNLVEDQDLILPDSDGEGGWETVTHQRAKGKNSSRPTSVLRCSSATGSVSKSLSNDSLAKRPDVPPNNADSPKRPLQSSDKIIPANSPRVNVQSESIENGTNVQPSLDKNPENIEQIIAGKVDELTPGPASEATQCVVNCESNEVTFGPNGEIVNSEVLTSSGEFDTANVMELSNISFNSNDLLSEEEDFTQNLIQLDKELADVANEESELTNELASAQQEYDTFRRELEEADKVVEEDEPVEELVDCHPPQESLTLDDILEKQKRFQGVNWAEINDSTDDESDELDTMRTPGRGVQLHEKFSSPSRKKRTDQSMEMLEEKQAKARDLREKLLVERTEKVRELTRKVEEVFAHKTRLLDEQKSLMNERLRRAETKRQAQLQRKIKKAHDEETKGREIAFIQSLEAAQKQHSIQLKHQECDARLQERQTERRRKVEVQQIKEAAAEERRRKMEASRQAKMQALQERWVCRERDLTSKAETKEKLRQEAARAKELDRENKIAAKAQQEKEHIENLKNKIQKKHEETERRHLEQLAEISRKAFEMSVLKHSNEDSGEAPPIEPYIEKKWCAACSVMINSEVFLMSHLRGKIHENTLKEKQKTNNLSKKEIEQFNLENIVDAPTDKPDPKVTANSERRKAMKKRIKKIKQRMTSKGTEFEKGFRDQIAKPAEFSNKTKFLKFIKEVRRYLEIPDSGPWVQARVAALDKSLGEAFRCLEKTKKEDQLSCVKIGIMDILEGVLKLVENQKPNHQSILPDKSFQLVCSVYRLCCLKNREVSTYIILSNRIVLLMDLLNFRINILISDDFASRICHGELLLDGKELPTDPVCISLMDTLTSILESCLLTSAATQDTSNNTPSAVPNIDYQRAQDVVSLVVSVGVVDKLSDYLTQVRGPLDEGSQTASFVSSALAFLTSLLKLLSHFKKSSEIFYKIPKSTSKGGGSGATNDGVSMTDDPTQLLTTICATELCGLVCLLYGILLYSGKDKVKSISNASKNITLVGLQMINHLAAIHLDTMQNVLSVEGISLQLRHILSHLLSYCISQYQPINISVISQSKHSLQSNNNNCTSISIQTLLHEVILCVGYIVVLNPENQNIVHSGQRPTILQQLCQLPFDYFSRKSLINILFPTLISCTLHNEENFNILEQEMSTSLLANFLEEKINEYSNGGPNVDAKSSSPGEDNISDRYHLANRFPVKMWSEAKDYYCNKQ